MVGHFTPLKYGMWSFLSHTHIKPPHFGECSADRTSRRHRRACSKSYSFLYASAGMASWSCCLSVCPSAIPRAPAPFIFSTQQASLDCCLSLSAAATEERFSSSKSSNISMLAKCQDLRMVSPTGYLN